jgi:hypothetical protein
MATVHLPFEKRIRKITRNHDRMNGAGVIYSVNHDGLIIARPRRRRASFPLRGVLLVIAAGFAFKGFLLADLGPATYGDRISASQSGTLIEQGSAWLMQVDPVTVWVAEQINAFLR